MNLTILNTVNEHWLEVHRTGCQHLNRRPLRYQDQSWTEDHESLSAAAESFACDFIAEGSMTPEEALDEVHFAPCVTLPLK